MSSLPRQTRTRRAVHQDENAPTGAVSRVTRAKSAQASHSSLPATATGPLKPIATRRRAALGDVSSNTNKDTVGSKPGAGASKLLSVKPSGSAATSNAANATARRAVTANAAVASARGIVSARRTGSTDSAAAASVSTSNSSRSTAARRPMAVRTSGSAGVAPSSSTTTASSSAAGVLAQRRAGRAPGHIAVYTEPQGPQTISQDEDTQDENAHVKRRNVDVVAKEAESRAQKRPRTDSYDRIDEEDEAQDTEDNEDAAAALAKARNLPAWDDLDKEDAEDPGMVSEYVVEIFEYLYELEKVYMPDPDYIEEQRHFTWETRGVLVDWLVEVHTKFRLLPETLFLAVNIIDRFLSKRVVSLDKVQLVGIAGLFIAAKCEEVFSPSISNYAYVSDGGYTEDQILEAERYVLQILDYNVAYPNALNFLRRISKADNYDIRTRTIGKYLLEISLLDHHLLKYTPSQCSAAAMYLARRMLNSTPEWDGNLIHYSGDVTEDELLPIVGLMVSYLKAPVAHDGFFKKYASKRFMKASIISRQWAKEHGASYT